MYLKSKRYIQMKLKIFMNLLQCINSHTADQSSSKLMAEGRTNWSPTVSQTPPSSFKIIERYWKLT